MLQFLCRERFVGAAQLCHYSEGDRIPNTTQIALVLAVVSEVVPAGWNLLSKSRHPSTSFFLIGECYGSGDSFPGPIHSRLSTGTHPSVRLEVA